MATNRQKDRKLARASAGELDARAKVTRADVVRAQAAWKKHAPPRFKRLLDARRK